MTTQDVLRQAKELLSDERNWTQSGGLWDRREDGGTSYCVLGALSQVQYGDPVVPAVMGSPATCAFEQAIGGDQLVGFFNDTTTHADLIAAFDRALLLVAEDTTAPERVAVNA